MNRTVCGLAAAVASWATVGLSPTTAGAVSGPRWTQPGYAAGHRNENAQEIAISAANVSGLTQRWSATVPPSPSQPVVADGRVIVLAGNTARAVRLSNGSQLWAKTHIEAGMDMFVSRPVITADGTVIAEATTVGVGGSISYNPVTGDSITNIRFHGGDNGFSVRGTTIRNTSFMYGSGGPFAATLNFGGPKPGLVWCCGFGASYSEPTLLGNRSFIRISGSIAMFEAGTCVPIPQTTLYCAANWSVDRASFVPVAIADDRIVIVDNDGALKVVDASTGATRWSATIPSRVVGAPAVARGRIYVAAENGITYTLRTSGCGAPTCAPRPWFTPAGTATTQPLIAGDVLYLGTSDGRINAYPADGCILTPCATRWSVDTGAAPVSGLIVVAGTVIATTTAGKVIAYRSAA